jgi:hypothetical protein
MSLVPVPSEPSSDTCPNCSAPIVADQRYCLSCGQPVAPVRLAFLDVLQAEGQVGSGASWEQGLPGDGYAGGRSPLLRTLGRYSGLIGLIGVLLLATLAGLLVGHWATHGSSAPGKQVVEVKGLPTVIAAPAGTTATATAPTSTAASKSAASEEAQEAKEAKEEEKKPAAAPTKAASPTTANKLKTTTGKQKQEELNKLGDQPIEIH